MTCWRRRCPSARDLVHHGRRWVLTLRASSFPEIFERSPSITDMAFEGDPLCQIDAARRGKAIQRLLKENLALFFPSSTLSEPPQGLCINGQRRSKHQSEFDWMLDGRRVECKSTRLAWDGSRCEWYARWSAIKLDTDRSDKASPFDDLLLVLHSPFRLDFLMHDLSCYVVNDGVRSSFLGQTVRCKARAGATDTSQAWQHIIQKLTQPPNACRHIASLRSDVDPMLRVVADEVVKKTWEHSWGCYKTVPLIGLTAASRSLRLQDLAFKIDQMLHPNSAFSIGVGAEAVVGEQRLQRRGTARGSADWWRDGERVEFKSSKMFWRHGRQCWSVHFAGVKDAAHRPDRHCPFDDLYLGIYSPCGFYLLRHAGDFALSHAGLATETRGRTICVSSSKCTDISTALECLLAKFQSAGCRVLAKVAW
ncbi:mad2l1-1 [Symbiodinium natans]|uniref:Mad2l1-1 protein n=1 Tax=Symbiodinium natans TaxID=878477 RepID=A0A812TKV2_9DINO|nr:mad2l1-1 [Symbiodinium natans]